MITVVNDATGGRIVKCHHLIRANTSLTLEQSHAWNTWWHTQTLCLFMSNYGDTEKKWRPACWIIQRLVNWPFKNGPIPAIERKQTNNGTISVPSSMTSNSVSSIRYLTSFLTLNWTISMYWKLNIVNSVTIKEQIWNRPNFSDEWRPENIQIDPFNQKCKKMTFYQPEIGARLRFPVVYKRFFSLI